MIKLFSFGPSFGVADPSPFVLKVDAYMRMCGIDFESVSSFGNLQRAPKGKLPYMEDDGEVIADSFFIMKHLKEKYGNSLDSDLSEEQKAVSQLITKSLDESLYWCLVYSRWLSEDTWPIVKETFFGGMPFPLKHIVPLIARRGVQSAFMKQGMGRHSHTEIMDIAETMLASLSTILAEKPYFFGDKPSTLDAVAYAFLAQLTISDLSNPLNERARGFTNLVSYCERIRQKYYEADSAV